MYQKRNKELEVISLYLRDYSKQFYLREISRLTRMPLKTTQNAVLNLEKEKILKGVIRGKNKDFALNLDSITTKFYLLHAEIHQTAKFLNKYPEFRTFLKDTTTTDLLVVFGSFAKFTADKNSDLDLMIVGKDKQKLPLHLLPYKVHKVELSEKVFIDSLNKGEALIKEIKQNHIILNNHSDFVNTIWEHDTRQKA